MLAALPSLLAGQPTALDTEPGAPVVTLKPAVPMPRLWIGRTAGASTLVIVPHSDNLLASYKLLGQARPHLT